MNQIKFEKISKSSTSNLYTIATNLENYEKLFPDFFPSIRVRSSRQNITISEQHFILGNKELVVMAKHVMDFPTHDIFFIGGDAKGSHIHEEYQEFSDGTKVIVNVSLKFGKKERLSNLFAKKNYQKDFEKLYDEFIQRSEY